MATMGVVDKYHQGMVLYVVYVVYRAAANYS